MRQKGFQILTRERSQMGLLVIDASMIAMPARLMSQAILIVCVAGVHERKERKNGE